MKIQFLGNPFCGVLQDVIVLIFHVFELVLTNRDKSHMMHEFREVWSCGVMELWRHGVME